MGRLSIKNPCPSCKKPDTISLHLNSIDCSTPGCQFKYNFKCPLCHTEVTPSDFNQEGTQFTCFSCKKEIQLKKIAYLIESGLHVDYEQRCTFCNGPTIHRSGMNLAHRCFDYPHCSGQSSLFSEAAESLTFIDVETTGLEIGRDELIEIGALKMDSEGYEHTFQTFIKPIRIVGDHITRITGITNEMLVGAPDLSTAFGQLLEFVGDSKIVAHNADFDLLWLLVSSARLKKPLPNNKVICTLKWARSLSEPRCSLGALTKKYAVGHQNAHRALADAAATKELYFVFENMNKTKPPQFDLSHFEPQVNRILERYSKVLVG